MSLVIALTTLPFWVLFAACLFFDLYLTHQLLGAILKSLFPVAVLFNIAGMVMGMVSAVRGRGGGITAIVGTVLNALPILSIGCILFWWVFLFKM